MLVTLAIRLSKLTSCETAERFRGLKSVVVCSQDVYRYTAEVTFFLG